ncbi:MAG: sulfatase-like hydrolase/transferase [Candidatus Synoicihabitans palmerolidicus]|nr:sulfatase-like hydrolase/transferase [Candidatus Synoicihabitans palmerolidicus]
MVLEEAARVITEAKVPTFLHVITLTNHHLYTYLAKHDGRAPGRIEAEYLRSARYVDDALQGFFAALEAGGVADDCLVAIYGDHDSAIDVEWMAYMDSFLPREFPDTVPLVMVGFDRPAQRVDLMAELQDVPVMVLQDLGLNVPLTFTGNGWGWVGPHRECLAWSLAKCKGRGNRAVGVAD